MTIHPSRSWLLLTNTKQNIMPLISVSILLPSHSLYFLFLSFQFSFSYFFFYFIFFPKYLLSLFRVSVFYLFVFPSYSHSIFIFLFSCILLPLFICNIYQPTRCSPLIFFPILPTSLHSLLSTVLILSLLISLFLLFTFRFPFTCFLFPSKSLPCFSC